MTQDNPDKADFFSRYAVEHTGNHRCKFLHVSTGFPGRYHEARLWNETSVGPKLERQEILQYPEQIIFNTRMKPIILGDGAYTLSGHHQLESLWKEGLEY